MKEKVLYIFCFSSKLIMEYG